MELLGKNVDLIHCLQSSHRFQELAYNQVLRSGWEGSENVFAASLLSSVNAFKGEAQGYLRGAEKWLQIYFRERKKQKPRHFHQEVLQVEDVVEFAWADLNLFGAASVVKFLASWSPPEYGFRVARLLIRRMVDADQFSLIDEVALLAKQRPYLILAIADELSSVARFPPTASLRPTLVFLARKDSTLEKAGRFSYEDLTKPALLALCEAAAVRRLSRSLIGRVMAKFTSKLADREVGDNFQQESRRNFIRGAALKTVLRGEPQPDPNSFVPKKDEAQGRTYDRDRSSDDIVTAIRALMPLYFLRARILVGDRTLVDADFATVRAHGVSDFYHSYRAHDRLPYEAAAIWFEVLACNSNTSIDELEAFAKEVIARAKDRFYLIHRVRALRTAFRLSHLASLRERLELSCRHDIEEMFESGPDERAEWYISLARAVLPRSREDASVYFGQAVDAVSKFGDEVVDRWRAVVAVARRAATAGPANAKITDRFIRCGEMVGETVQREKYWDRDEVFSTAVHLHCPTAFAGLSRWRDRGVGEFDSQLSALVIEAVEGGHISPACGWGLTGFQGCNASVRLAVACLTRERDSSTREGILRMAQHDLELSGNGLRDFERLAALAEEFPARKAELTDLIDRLRMEHPLREEPQRAVSLTSVPSKSPPRIAAMVRNVDVMNANELERVVAEFHVMETPRDFQAFWREVCERVPSGREAAFLTMFSGFASINPYDAGEVITRSRAGWMQKAAVQRGWLTFLTQIGKRFSVALSNSERLSYWSDQCVLGEDELRAVRLGLVDGLAESLELVGASTFFGFVGSVAERIAPADALEILEYALGRFEVHIPRDFADGEWAEWRQPQGIDDGVTGLIWSALGSPISSMRWEATHSVRRMAEFGRMAELSALLARMKSGGVGAFGCNRYPFYVLHARLHLLVALARVTIDNPTLMKSYAPVFADVALEGLPHILIQKNAADIALGIEGALPGTYPSATVVRLRNVGVSPLPPRLVDDSVEYSDSPWHAAKQVDENLYLSFDHEFDHYWFDQLARIFAIPEAQIQDLAREIAVNQLGIPRGEKYGHVPDPRSHQWEGGDYHERGTSHSHGSYPRIHTYNFYYSYHSFLCVASRLLANVPVVREIAHDWTPEPFADWLNRHSITRLDGRWLADRRDPPPLRRREWVGVAKSDHWRWEVGADDFHKIVTNHGARPGFLCVDGSWTECVYDRMEQLRVRSALVHRDASAALAASLRTARDAHDFALPTYGSEHGEFRRPPFELTGWLVKSGGGDLRMDEFDPHAKEIAYPPNEIAVPIAQALGLSPDYERRVWHTAGATTPSAINEIWSDYDPSKRPPGDLVGREGGRR